MQALPIKQGGTGRVDGGNLLSPGAVGHFGMASPPVGWLKANGALVSRTAYTALYAAIGTTFGAGDGSTTFAVPDLRGQFIRSWVDNGSTDSGRTFGSGQADSVKDHTHVYSYNSDLTLGGSSGARIIPGGGATNSGSTGSMTSSPGTETRPVNVALLACVKY